MSDHQQQQQPPPPLLRAKLPDGELSAGQEFWAVCAVSGALARHKADLIVEEPGSFPGSHNNPRPVYVVAGFRLFAPHECHIDRLGALTAHVLSLQTRRDYHETEAARARGALASAQEDLSLLRRRQEEK